jgi:hypothetical protein
MILFSVVSTMATWLLIKEDTGKKELFGSAVSLLEVQETRNRTKGNIIHFIA